MVVLVVMKMLNVIDGVKGVMFVVLCEMYGVLLCVLYLVVLYVMFELWKVFGYVDEFGLLFDVLWLKVDEVVFE